MNRLYILLMVLMSGVFLVSGAEKPDFKEESRIIEKFVNAVQSEAEGKYKESISYLEEIIDLRDDLFVPYLHIIKICKDEERALKLAEDFLSRYPDNTEALETYGGLLISSDHYEKAIDTYRKLIEIRCDRLEYYAQAGRLMFFHGRKDEAKDHLMHYAEHIESNKPQDELIYYLIGNLFEMDKEYSAAAYYYMKSIELHPYYSYSLKALENVSKTQKLNIDIALFYKIMIDNGQNRDYFTEAFISYVLANNVKEYLPYIIGLYEAVPEEERDLNYYRRLNYARFLSSDYYGIIKSARGLISIEECDMNLLMLLYNSYIKTGQYNSAKNLLNEYKDIFPAVDYQMMLYELLVLEKKEQEALSLLENLHDENPQSDDIFIELINAIFHLRSKKTAIEVLNQILSDRQPREFKLWALYIEMLLKNNDIKEAIISYEKMIKENKNLKQAYMLGFSLYIRAGETVDKTWIADLYLDNFNEVQDYLISADYLMRLKEYEAAESVFKEALDVYPDDRDVLFSYSGYCFQVDAIDKSIEILEGLNQKNPYSPDICNSLGYSYVLEGRNMDTAYDLLTYAVKIEPLNPAFLDSLGWYHYNNNQFDKALHYLLRACEISSSDPEISEHLGLIYQKNGDYDKALEYFKKSAGQYADKEDIERINAFIEKLSSGL